MAADPKDSRKDGTKFNQQYQIVNGTQYQADQIHISNVDPRGFLDAARRERKKYLEEQERLRRRDEERREEETQEVMLTVFAILGVALILFLISLIGNAILDAVT
ncbi:hypothetical protein ACN6LC_004485 [Streptomyces violaceoruber]|uniref:hypothetical protein n=1 Tax=Streptomyces violaceoruber group TaxID=2867121 RepID=UPI0033F1B897